MQGRKAKPPRLWQRADGSWIILDRGRQIRTGCGPDETAAAAEKLYDYIGAKHRPVVTERNPDKLPIALVLTSYEDAKNPTTQDPDRLRRHDELIARLLTLNEFLGDKHVGDIKAQLCRDYVAWRTHGLSDRSAAFPPRKRKVSMSSARRELEDLRSAVNAYHAEHILSMVPKITLPEKAPARERWLTRGEAARLLAAALGFVWDIDRRAFRRTDDGKLVRRDRVTRARRRHAARFILLGIYSGRREATLRRTEWSTTLSAPWIDLDRFIYHGRGADERKTKKRRPPAKLANRLRPHLVRWKWLDDALGRRLGVDVRHVVHRPDGRPLSGKIKTAWAGICADAGLGRDVLRHTLKHTAATWQMQSGTDLWSAAGFLGITVEQLEDGYGHHHPDFQESAAAAFGGRR